MHGRLQAPAWVGRAGLRAAAPHTQTKGHICAQRSTSAVNADLGAGHAGFVGAGRHLLIKVITSAHKHVPAHDEAVLAGGLGRGVGLRVGLGEAAGRGRCDARLWCSAGRGEMSGCCMGGMPHAPRGAGWGGGRVGGFPLVRHPSPEMHLCCAWPHSLHGWGGPRGRPTLPPHSASA